MMRVGLAMIAIGAASLASAGRAQQPTVGTVATDDATVTGAASTVDGRASIVGSGVVTAKDHTAEVRLARGGTVRVCATSRLHLTAGAAKTPAAPPLMLALDQGAMEVHVAVGVSDVVMTPDLRLSVKSDGPLDLRLRVTPNGDTCVENRLVIGAAKTPALEVSSLFGDASYDVKPGQHVLFEHGDLHEVVDDESSPCGCPDDASLPISMGGALGPGVTAAGQQAAIEHPFPAAVSEGLAPTPAVPQETPGIAHAQVATTLSYSPSEATVPPNTEPPLLGEGVQHAEAPRPMKPGVLRRIGRFFKRYF